MLHESSNFIGHFFFYNFVEAMLIVETLFIFKYFAKKL